MIRTPYRAKGGAAQVGAALPGQAGFGVRPEPTPDPDAPDHASENPASAWDREPSLLSDPDQRY
ncbi:hypothetical protein GCM10017600_26620 [Streptosporangium carneum]|uniref:Uncharacterized protein n=1 Tax=Streptosporangium carneum TaxID=47481 RepID=A0A9W6HZN1_9ACTN|nr:hypothetical protein GCM10017600_26620 [Streptosporangium carneum]